MTTDTSRPLIEHATRCQRRGAPVLLAPWASGPPWLACPECGRRTPYTDTTERNHR